MTKSTRILDLSHDDLVANLKAIASPSEITLISSYLKLDTDQAHETNAKQKAALRTKQYKLRKQLQRAPSSEHISQACAYIVFSRYQTPTPSPQPIVQEVQDLLIAAGFDKQGTTDAMTSFVTGVGVRKSSWVARNRSRLQIAIFKAIEAFKAQD